MTSWKPQPRLRQKQEVDTGLSDKEIFQRMPLGDLWPDANLVEVYRYVRAHRRSAVPSSWVSVLEELDAELDRVCPKF